MFVKARTLKPAAEGSLLPPWVRVLKFGVLAARYGKVRAGPRKKFESSALVRSKQRSAKKKLAARFGEVRGGRVRRRSLPRSGPGS